MSFWVRKILLSFPTTIKYICKCVYIARSFTPGWSAAQGEHERQVEVFF